MPDKIAFLIPFLLIFLAQPLVADFGSFESKLSPEEAGKRMKKILTEIDRGNFFEEDNTLGFSYRLESRFLSPYKYSFFSGLISTRLPKTIIRIEAGAGDINLWSHIMQQEGVLIKPLNAKGPKPRRLESKSHIIAQSLNLAAPWLAPFYIAYNSPRLSRKQMWYRSLFYLIADGVLVYIAGTNGFNSNFQTKGREGAIAAALALPRILGAWQNANTIRGHNRISELKYVFPLP